MTELGMPRHRSVSQLTSFTRCGEAFRLERVAKAPQRPAAWFHHGTAVHHAIEQYELSGRALTAAGVQHLAVTEYDRLIAEALNTEPDFSRWMTGGNKRGEKDVEDRRGVVASQAEAYVLFAEAHSEEWRILTLGGTPAVEVEFRVDFGGVEVLGYIDQIRQYRDGRIQPVDIKGLALDTPLATPTGWTTMGEVQVGDQVLGANGAPVTVTVKSEEKRLDCYRVTFNDGTSIVCDEEHLWEVTQRRTRKRAVVPVTELGHQPGMRDTIRNADPVELPAVEYAIDPYTLGVWLADGNRGRQEFSKDNDGMAVEIRKLGEEVREWKPDKRTGCRAFNVIGLKPRLREIGVLGNKHVPQAYLRGSIQQRQALVQGLMDGDGTWHKARKEAKFYSTDAGLADAVYEALVSLGEKPVRHTQRTGGYGKEVDCHSITWQPRHFNPFRAEPKAALATVGGRGGNRWRVVRSVEKVDSVPTACIGVDAEDHLYLAGRQMVPTHNTGSRKQDSAFQLAIYAHAINANLGILPITGVFWEAKHVADNEMLLTGWSKQLLDDMFVRFDEAERRALYVPNPGDACRVCSVRDYCRINGSPDLAEGYADKFVREPAQVN